LNDLLKTIANLSREFGTLDFVKSTGGITSAKTADTLWVKSSDATLAGLTPDEFVEIDRQKLGQLQTLEVPADASACESFVQSILMSAVKSGHKVRLPAEALLHDILPGTYVIQTQPALVNGMTCAKNGAAVCAHLFPQALWLPYTDSGLARCLEVRRRIRAQRLVMLENRGLIVTGDTMTEIRETYRRVLDILREEYQTAGISAELDTLPKSNEPEPVTPEHIVFGKNPKFAPAMAEESALIRQLAAAFGGIKLLDARARKFVEDCEF
jgi:rhamnose utilization protein RhaD (predicted bifunctional aldolase and dehydrogenase)